MKEVTFIHAADLHLDSPMTGLKHLPKQIFLRLQESTFHAFRKLIDAALTFNVDFVILAGDLYDGENRSLRAQTRFRKEMERLLERNIPVYIVHGNHDHLGGMWPHFQMPDNVHIFKEHVESKDFQKSDGTTVRLYGFSYPDRHVFDRMITQYKREEGADFHIGILHGYHEGSSDHGKYAPFHLKELLEKQFDYWALGHIHKRSILSEFPPVLYPGNIQGRNKKETGIKGCYFVSLTEHDASLQFVETSDVIWEDVKTDAEHIDSVHELYEFCRKTMEEYRREGIGTLLHLSLTNVKIDGMHTQLSEWLELFQEEEKDESSFVWPVKIEVEEKVNWERSKLTLEADFYRELFEAIDEYRDIEECLSPLYQHPNARKYLNALDEYESARLKKEAEDLLIRSLLRKEAFE
ncbi:DNA repair exonuclease [Bacillus methanolicus]|uniref:metallophosphoesterase family protein n=1 Tax=Bacillus methanolicus TaxID=1471 RepID=UPI00200BF7D2|nr:DNA repair exonuclease [Bacillus methanolicus]UQD51317.1 DNA repair exonuclease [Bacillus methanolicus]